MGKSPLIGSVYLPDSLLMLLSRVGEGDELPDQQIDIQTLYILAEISEPHVRQQRVVIIRIPYGYRRPTEFQCAH